MNFAGIWHRPLVSLSNGTITLASIITAILIVACAWAASAFWKRALMRFLDTRELSAGAKFATIKVSGYVIVLLGFFVAVHSVGINLTALFAAGTVVLVGIGLGLQKIAENFIAGVIVLIEQPIRCGDFIRVGDAHGIVQNIGLRATTLMTRDEVTMIVPNSQLISTNVINHSVPTTRMRIAIKIGVGYASDLELVRQVLLEVAKKDSSVLGDPPAEVRFEDFGESSLEMTLLVWITEPQLDRRIASTLRFAMNEICRKNKIELPFPQRDVHLRQP